MKNLNEFFKICFVKIHLIAVAFQNDKVSPRRGNVKTKKAPTRIIESDSAIISKYQLISWARINGCEKIWIDIVFAKSPAKINGRAKIPA